MKKKILIVIFVLAISLCFAFACSASEYDFISCENFKASFVELNGIYEIQQVQYLKDGKTLTLTMFVISAAGLDTMGNTVYSIQPYAFKIFVDTITEKNGDCTYDYFIQKVEEIMNNYTLMHQPIPEFYRLWRTDSDPDNPYYRGVLNEKYFNLLYHYKDELTYSEGYAQGITDFTQSTAYQDTLALEKETGQAEGKDMFMASAEYKAALQKEYDNGYDKALLVSEQKQATNIVGIALGSCGIGLLVLLAVYFISARKKQKRK